MGLEKGIVLTLKEKEMFIKGLKQALLHTANARDGFMDETETNEAMDAAEDFIKGDIEWHENEMKG